MGCHALRARYVPPCSNRIACTQGVTAYKTDPAWLSWLALVEFETAELADSFTKPSIENLDKLQLKHHKLYFKVPEYTGSEKPKFFLRVNYPVDILYTGPMIRTWCMSFEALLQVLKAIARSSNYKNVEERMARIWSVRQALMFYHDKFSTLGEVEVTYASSAITVDVNGINLDTFVNVDTFGLLVRIMQTQRVTCGIHGNATRYVRDPFLRPAHSLRITCTLRARSNAHVACLSNAHVAVRATCALTDSLCALRALCVHVL